MRINLPISKTDKRILRFVMRSTSSRTARVAQAVSWATDARVLLPTAVFWRLLQRKSAPEANRLILVLITTTTLHHAIKRIVAQPRPDRVEESNQAYVTGRPLDAFPSGHAMHAGAIASFIAARAPMLRPLAWAFGGVSSLARVVMLAHWPSGVVAGFAIGAAVDRLTRSIVAASHVDADRRA